MQEFFFMCQPGQLSILACVLLGWMGMLTEQVPAVDTRPNYVFLMADDLGWGDVAFHGGNAPTPHLDRLAREGLELTQHYVAPVCSPTRAALLTGRYWSRFDITIPINTQALPHETVTLARALQEAGYATCLTGKWHLGSLPRQGPNGFGFDHAYGSLAGGVSPWNHRYKQGPFSETWHRNGTLVEETGHVTDLLANEAIHWLRQRDSQQPFFLYVPFTAVHLPVKEPVEWVNRVPRNITGNVARHYAASIMHLDDSVGRILETLEQLGQRRNTLVVFTSDNGASSAENNDPKYPADKCPDGRLTGSNRPFRGEKATLYEGGIRVPTLVSWPGQVKPGKVATPVQIADWMPTLCALADIQPSKDLKWDGIDLTPVLTQHAPLPERPLYAVAPKWRGRSVRLGNWKLIVQTQDQQQQIELFDMATDPGESRNQAQNQPERVKNMLRLLEDIAQRDRDAVVAPPE